MQPNQSDNLEIDSAILKQYEEYGLIVTVYSVPKDHQPDDMQHIRPKGMPMLTPGCSWVIIPGGV